MPSVAFVVFACFAVLASSAADNVLNRCNPTTSTPCSLTQAAGIWTTPQEVAAIPMSGDHWVRLLAAADTPITVLGIAKPYPDDVVPPSPDGLHNINSKVDTNTLAAALVWARTGNVHYRNKVVTLINALMGTEDGGRSLGASRNLVSVVCAADLIQLAAFDPAVNTNFVNWLTAVRKETLGITQRDLRSIFSTHNDRPNNWGTMAGASRIAADIYLGDTVDLALAINVFRGYLGDRTAWANFKYGDEAGSWSWQSDPANPRGINPVGATKLIGGVLRDVDGVLPDDLRRAQKIVNGVKVDVGLVWPPPKEMYVWEALQGVLVQARLLYRRGYDSWNWGDKAIWRAVKWQVKVALFPAVTDDLWQNWIINRAYNPAEKLPEPLTGVGAGKNMGFTNWMLSLPGSREDVGHEEAIAEALAKQAAHNRNLMILGATSVVVAVVILAAGLFVWKKRQQAQQATTEYVQMSEIMADS